MKREPRIYRNPTYLPLPAPELEVDVLHVGCVFRDTTAVRDSYFCVGYATQGQCGPVLIVFEGDVPVYNPRVCLFQDHTGWNIETVYVFKHPQIINWRRFAGTYMVPRLHHPDGERTLELLGDSTQPPVQTFEQAPFHNQVLTQCVFRRYIDSLLRATDRHTLNVFVPQPHHVRWYEAYLNLCALRLVCKTFAFDRRLIRAVQGIQTFIRTQAMERFATVRMISSIAKYRRPAQLLSYPVQPDHCGSLLDVVERMLSSTGPERVQVLVANYHKAPIIPHRLFCVMLSFNGRTLHRTVGKLLDLARLFEYCGHGFDGREYTYVSIVSAVRNRKHMTSAQKLEVISHELRNVGRYFVLTYED